MRNKREEFKSDLEWLLRMAAEVDYSSLLELEENFVNKWTPVMESRDSTR